MQRQNLIMHWSRIAIISIILCAVLLVTGCTQSSTQTPVPASGSSEGQVSLYNLALTSADIPANYTLAESRVKDRSEVSGVARDLGWKAGYLVRYTSLGSCEIRQTITQYPATNIPNILANAESADRAVEGMAFSDLPSPGIGTTSQAFVGKISAASQGSGQIIPTIQSGSSQGPANQKFIEILFTKGGIFEVIRMSGPESDYTVLKGIAAAAYNKIS